MLTGKCQKNNFQYYFRGHCSIGFIMISFYQIPSTWCKIYKWCPTTYKFIKLKAHYCLFTLKIWLFHLYSIHVVLYPIFGWTIVEGRYWSTLTFAILFKKWSLFWSTRLQVNQKHYFKLLRKYLGTQISVSSLCSKSEVILTLN